MRKRLLSLCLVLCLSLPSFVRGEETSPPDLYARSAVLMDGESGRILYEKNGYDPMPNASTTKILTCILALENGDPEQICKVSSFGASQPKVNMGAVEGEEYRLKDLLYGLMLESYNDAAVILAEAISGSTEAFAELMNQKAWDLGCEQSYFITPNGLDAADEKGVHSATAADLARIMSYCICNPDFLEITQTPQYTFSECSGKRTISCYNHNAFLQMMDGALSGKTGFTGNAGYCYVGALQRDGKTLVVALLACGWPNNKSYKWSDTRHLMQYGLENFERINLWEKPELPVVSVFDGIPISLDLSDSGQVTVTLEQESEGLWMLLSEQDKVERKLSLPGHVIAPVHRGQQLGTLQYLLNGEEIAVYPIVAEEDVETVSYTWCLRRVLEVFLSESGR